MSRLTLLNGFELSGNLSASFVPVKGISVFSSIEKLRVWAELNKKSNTEYSIHISSVMSGKDLGLSEKILLKINFKKNRKGFEVILQPNWSEHIWVNIWTRDFRSRLYSFLGTFIASQRDRMDNERWLAISEFRDKLPSKSSIQIIFP